MTAVFCTHFLYIYVFFPFKNKVQIFIAPLLCLIAICLGMNVWCFVAFMLTFCLKICWAGHVWLCRYCFAVLWGVAVRLQPSLFWSSSNGGAAHVVKGYVQIVPNSPNLPQVVSRCKKKSYNLHVKIRFCTFASYKPNYSFIYNKQLW